MPKHDIIYKKSNDVLFLSFEKEELKLEDAERIVEIVFDDEENWETEKVVFEFSKVTYVNSTVISAIGRMADAKELKIVGMTEKVRNIMDMMGILPFLDLYDDIGSALKDFD